MIDIIAGGYAKGGARGLYPLAYDPATETLTAGAPVAQTVNVSAGLPLPNGQWMLVDEMAGEVVRSAGPNGDWCELERTGSGGEAPCYLALGKDRLAVANYESGTTALFRVEDGRLGSPSGRYRHQGSGPVPDRQNGPHAHWVGFAKNGCLYVCDLGADAVLAFTPGSDTLGEPIIAYAAPPGSGPRQLAFHPTLPIAFLVSELAATLTMLRVEDDGRLAATQVVATARPDAPADNLGGAIALSPAGDRVFVTNRGDNSVAAFAVGDNGHLTLIGYAPSGGKSPRYLLLLPTEQRLLVAHEEGGGVTALALDKSCQPHATSARAEVPSAAFLARIGA